MADVYNIQLYDDTYDYVDATVSSVDTRSPNEFAVQSEETSVSEVRVGGGRFC